MLVAGDAHGAEDAAEAVGAHALHQAGVDAVQVLVDVGRAEHLRHLALTGQAIVAEEELLHGLVATVTAVAALDVAHLIADIDKALLKTDTVGNLTCTMRFNPGYNRVTFPIYFTPKERGGMKLKLSVESDSDFPIHSVLIYIPAVEAPVETEE